MSQEQAAEVEADLLTCTRRLLDHFVSHPKDVELLSTKYHAPYQRLIEEVNNGASAEDVLTMGTFDVMQGTRRYSFEKRINCWTRMQCRRKENAFPPHLRQSACEHRAAS
jgi:hypothetical protein